MKIAEIPLEKITSNPMNPRERFDREKIDELAKSIKTVGLKVPIIVRPKGNHYEIVSGERRWTAAKKAKLKKVTVIIKELNDDEMAIESLIANEFRENLDPWERAKFLKRIKKMAGVKTDADLGKLVGVSRDAILAAWEYLDVDEKVKEKVSADTLSARTARSIGRIPDKMTQRKVAEIVVKEDLTWRETEKFVSTIKKAPKPLKEAVLKQEIPIKRAEKAVKTYEKAKKIGREVPEKEVKRHVQQIKVETKEDKLRVRVRDRSHEDVLTGKKKSVDIQFDTGEADKFLGEVEEIVWTVKEWGVPMMMIVGGKAWNDARRHFKAIHDHMEFLLGKDFKHEIKQLK